MSAMMLASTVGGPLGGATEIISQTLGGEYKNLIAQGVPHERAFHAALNSALTQAPMEMLGLSKIMGVFGGIKRNIAKKILKTVEAAGTEWFTEFAQSVPQLVSEIWATNPDKSKLEQLDMILAKLPEALKQGAYEGTLTAPFAALGLAAPTAKKAPSKTPSEAPDYFFLDDRIRAERSPQDKLRRMFPKAETPAKPIPETVTPEPETVASDFYTRKNDLAESKRKLEVLKQRYAENGIESEIPKVEKAIAAIDDVVAETPKEPVSAPAEKPPISEKSKSFDIFAIEDTIQKTLSKKEIELKSEYTKSGYGNVKKYASELDKNKVHYNALQNLLSRYEYTDRDTITVYKAHKEGSDPWRGDYANVTLYPEDAKDFLRSASEDARISGIGDVRWTISSKEIPTRNIIGIGSSAEQEWVIKLKPVSAPVEKPPVGEKPITEAWDGKERREFFGIRDKVDRGLMTKEDARAGKKPEVVIPESRLTASAADLAADYKARGIERQATYSRFVQDRALKPEMDAKEFYAIYDSVTPKLFEPITEPPTVIACNCKEAITTLY
jgi:hypothetical protein